MKGKTQKLLQLPEVIETAALRQLDKTHKLSAGRFVAIAALYFNGKRIQYVSVIAESRNKALRAASDFIQSGPRALQDSDFANMMRQSAHQSELRLRAMGG